MFFFKKVWAFFGFLTLVGKGSFKITTSLDSKFGQADQKGAENVKQSGLTGKICCPPDPQFGPCG